MPNQTYALEWLNLAKRNLDTARLLIRENHYTDSIAIETTMLSNRKNLVQTNQALLNELFDQLNEILSTGKTLYKKVDLAKQKGYTFNELKKRVRKTSKPDNEPTSEPEI